MSKTKLKESSRHFLRLLKLSIISFVSMGVLIGYHGAPLINSLIGVFWFVFAVTSGLVLTSALSKETDSIEAEKSSDRQFEELESLYCKKPEEDRHRKRSSLGQTVSESA